LSSAEFYAPYFKILIGKTELRHGETMDVLSVSVTDTIDRADSLALTVRDRHPDHERLFAGGAQLEWTDSNLFEDESEVEVHMGYVDDLHLLLRGKIKAAATSFPASGQPTLRLEGYNLYHDLLHRHRRKPFEATTDSGVAEEIARLMGLKAKVDKTKAEHPLLSPKGDSFAAFLQKRARRIGYEVAVKDCTLYFQKPRYRADSHPTLTLEWGRNLNSFSPRVTTHDMVTKVTVRASQTTQGGHKDPLVGEAKAGAERVKLGKETGSEVAKRVHKENEILITDHDIFSQDEANQMALAELEARSLGFITGRGSVIGNPKLRARTVIELKGLGKRFSGKYYVTSTTHTIDASGYRTDFEVKRNAQWA
jgi:phage protein D